VFIGEAGRLANRPARVAPQCGDGHVGGDGRRGSTTGTAGGALRVPWVAARAEGRVLRGRAHRELVEVRLANDQGTGGPELANYRGLVRRVVALEDPRSARRWQAVSADVVLDAHRDSSQWADFVAARQGAIDGGGLLEQLVPADRKEGVDARFSALRVNDRFERGSQKLGRPKLAGTKPLAKPSALGSSDAQRKSLTKS